MSGKRRYEILDIRDEGVGSKESKGQGMEAKIKLVILMRF